MKKLYHFILLLPLIGTGLNLWAIPAYAELSCATEQQILAEFDNGSAWRMCWESRTRENIVLSEVQFKPVDKPYYSVFSSLRMSQLHVTYDDSNVTYNDVTQFGLGAGYIKSLDENDCPSGELIDIAGRPGMCVTQSDADELYKTAQDTRRSQSLSIYSTSMVGAYAYLITWKFFADGSIAPSIGAAGALQRSSDDEHSHFGRKLAGSEDKSWLSHTHNYYWRLDFDLGDQATDDFVNEISFSTDSDGRRSRASRKLDTESARAIAPQTMTAWEVIDGGGNMQSDIASAPAYLIEPVNHGHKMVNKTNTPYTEFDFFVTKQSDCERFVSENAKFYPDCDENILQFVNDESIVGEDIVLWHRISFHHVPRNEDRSIMHSHWDGFTMEARNLHSGTPGYTGTASESTLAAMRDAEQSDSSQLQAQSSDGFGCSLSTRTSAGLSMDLIALFLMSLMAIFKPRLSTRNLRTK